MRRGQGEVYGEGASYVVDSRQPYRFTGTGLRDYQHFAAPGPDEFDRWSSDRDRSYDSSVSARYVSPDVVGYQDLDANGTWRVDADLRQRVGAESRGRRLGALPRRTLGMGRPVGLDVGGRRALGLRRLPLRPLDEHEWHVGLGAGSRAQPAYYAPALVAFVGGNNFQLAISSGNVGGIAWFPLGPREVYRPSYAVSRGYFENVNRSNTVVNNTVINNYYNNTNVTNVVYANRQVPGAVIAVPTTTFVQSQPVAQGGGAHDAGNGGQRAGRRCRGASRRPRRACAAPPPRATSRLSRVFERPVVARTAPPAGTGGLRRATAATRRRSRASRSTTAARKELKPRSGCAGAGRQGRRPAEGSATDGATPAGRNGCQSA